MTRVVKHRRCRCVVALALARVIDVSMHNHASSRDMSSSVFTVLLHVPPLADGVQRGMGGSPPQKLYPAVLEGGLFWGQNGGFGGPKLCTICAPRFSTCFTEDFRRYAKIDQRKFSTFTRHTRKNGVKIRQKCSRTPFLFRAPPPTAAGGGLKILLAGIV